MKDSFFVKIITMLASAFLFVSCYVICSPQNAYAASPVNVIDSIVLTQESDQNVILAEWSAGDPSITVNSNFSSLEAVRLFINWSDSNGTIDLHEGDYFSFVFPEIFDHGYISDASNVPIKNPSGDTVAVYSIASNGAGLKEVTITFTDYVEGNTDISGNFWALLYVGAVSSTENADLEFVINGNLEAGGQVTINPADPSDFVPKNSKTGYSSPVDVVDGYYIFEWVVYFNMEESPSTGFGVFDNFSFTDTLPANSPHVFLTDEIRQQLGISSADYVSEIGEYTGADPYSQGSRYGVFVNHYNGVGGIWYDYINWNTLSDGIATIGIDGGNGLDISNTEVTEKTFSADLGTLTRPTSFRYYTISTIKLAESALGDPEVAQLYSNSFEASSGDTLDSTLSVYRFEAGGSAQGISGDLGFSFTKVDEGLLALADATFSLFISDDFSVGANRIAASGNDGVVAFNSLPEGTYYLQETIAPEGYVLDNTVYRVDLNTSGFEIYWGDNFENRLSDNGNQIVNRLDVTPQSISVILEGEKNLTGKDLEDGMFSFIIKNEDGDIVSTGSNGATGSITFSALDFDTPGNYLFTAAEVMDNQSGIIYDSSEFQVMVRVFYETDGSLASAIEYLDGAIVFNNTFEDEAPEPEPEPEPEPGQPGDDSQAGEDDEGKFVSKSKLPESGDDTMLYALLITLSFAALLLTGISILRVKE